MKKALIILPIAGLLLVALAVAQVSEDIIVSADVQPYYSVVFNYASVSFCAVYPGPDIPAPGNSIGAYNVSIEANIALRLNASKTPWMPADAPGFVLEFASGYEIPTAPAYIIDVISTTVGYTSPGVFTHYHAYWLDIPPELLPDIYLTTVTLTYEPA